MANRTDIEDTSVWAIQFIHPGQEHVIGKRQVTSAAYIYDWNSCKNQHKRKFMKVCGQYLDSTTDLQSDSIYFWGEWEPWSKITSLSSKIPQGDYPHYVHEPTYFAKSTPPLYCHKRGTNTDPFVFGDNFFYSLCQQYRKTGPTKLNRLSPGSIILFGSCINPRTPNAYFALDTVFVVGEQMRYTAKAILRRLDPFFPAHYNDIMGFRYWKDKTQNLMAYKGASYTAQYEGMYSFVPCKVGKDGMNGFKRAKLTNADLMLISNNLSQGFKAQKSTISDNIDLWKTIRDIIRRQGFYEGVRMDYVII